MKLTFLGTTSGGGNCPNLYATDRGTYIYQGDRITDPEVLATLKARGLPDHETAVEVPTALLRFVPQFDYQRLSTRTDATEALTTPRDGVKLTFLGATSGDGGNCSDLYATDRGTYILQGERITDPEALTTLRARGLPDHETAVEVPAELLKFAPHGDV